jgi:hypothetical protein
VTHNNNDDDKRTVQMLAQIMPLLERIQRRELTADDIQRIQAVGIDIDQLYEVIPEHRDN